MIYMEEHFTTRGFKERIQLMGHANRFISLRVTTGNKVVSFNKSELEFKCHLLEFARDELILGKRSIYQNLPFRSQIVVVYEVKEK